MSLMIFAIPFLVALATWFYLTKIRKEDPINKFPGPPKVPFMGNALDFPTTIAFLPALQRYIKEYGDIVRVTIGARSLLVVSNTGFLELLLTSMKFIDKSDDYNVLHDWLGRGLLTSTGKKWHTHRKIITPTFHFEILEQFVDVFNQASNVLVHKLEKEVGKESMDIYPYITLCALDIICETAMGTTVNAQDDPDSVYVRCVKEMSRIVVDKTFSPLKQFDFFFQFSRDSFKLKKYLKILHGFSNSVIMQRRETLLNQAKENESNITDNGDGIGKKKKMAFLDLLLHATIDGQPLPDADIREEVDTFMFEGHDTTASAMAFCLYCLATNKRVQDEAFEELCSIFGNDVTQSATHRNLQDMQYMELVIKETLRLFPSVPFYARELPEDVTYDGKLLPKGTTITVFAFGIQRDERFFTDPETFNPERFLSENQSSRPFYSYIPFSAGPRNCIGQKFAMLEMKSTISKVLRHYELFPTNPVHKLELAAETILKSANGIKIKLKKRVYPS